MKIKYIKKVEYCCKEMKIFMKNPDFIDYENKSFNITIKLRDGGSIEGRIQWCPFCGEEIEFI